MRPASCPWSFLLRITGFPCKDGPHSANTICLWVNFTQDNTKSCKNWRLTLLFYIKLSSISHVWKTRLKHGPECSELCTGWGMIFLASPPLSHSDSGLFFSQHSFPYLHIVNGYDICLFLLNFCPGCRSIFIMSRPLGMCENNPIHTFLFTLLSFSGWSNNQIDMR